MVARLWWICHESGHGWMWDPLCTSLHRPGHKSGMLTLHQQQGASHINMSHVVHPVSHLFQRRRWSSWAEKLFSMTRDTRNVLKSLSYFAFDASHLAICGGNEWCWCLIIGKSTCKYEGEVEYAQGNPCLSKFSRSRRILCLRLNLADGELHKSKE